MRHGVLEPLAAHHHDDPLGVPGEVEGGLRRGVRAADDVDVVPLALRRLGGGRAVVDAAAGELVDAGALEPPVGHAARDHDRTRLEVGAVVEADRPHRSPALEADDVAREQHLGAEAAGLGDGPVREVGAGQALREAEVVLDRRALAGLPAGRLLLDDDGAQPLGRRVDAAASPAGPRRRCTGRRAAARPGCAGPGRRQVEVGRRPQRVAVGHEHERQLLGARARQLGERRASSSRSTSSHWYGTWLRVRKVLTSWLRGDHRWPTTRSSPVSCGCDWRQSPSRSSTTG
jgi:hypothetical protein